MPVCDICGKNLSQWEIKELRACEVVDATLKGFIPSKLPAQMFGISVSIGEQWRYAVKRNSTVDWGVCATCFEELRNY